MTPVTHAGTERVSGSAHHAPCNTGGPFGEQNAGGENVYSCIAALDRMPRHFWNMHGEAGNGTVLTAWKLVLAEAG